MVVIKAVQVTECTCSVQNSLDMQGSFEVSHLEEGSEEALKFRGQTLQRWCCRKGEKAVFVYLVVFPEFKPL